MTPGARRTAISPNNRLIMARPATEAGIVGSAKLESNEVHNPRKSSVHSFVISWYGKHDNAEKIIRAITPASDSVTAIYSDPDNNLYPQFSCQAIRRPNYLFFGDKFQACIDAFDSDVMLLIHADCDCDNWSEIPARCRDAVENIPNIGVWAPTIDFNYWSVERTEIDRDTQHILLRCCRAYRCDSCWIDSSDSGQDAKSGFRGKRLWVGNRPYVQLPYICHRKDFRY